MIQVELIRGDGLGAAMGEMSVGSFQSDVRSGSTANGRRSDQT
jgi:hypothetical protein